MPLLRAVDVREAKKFLFDLALTDLSQCPCCGRSMCGLRASNGAAGKGSAAVSMPLLRAVDVRVDLPGAACVDLSSLSQCPCCGRSMCGNTGSFTSFPFAPPCLNALVAGGRCAGLDALQCLQVSRDDLSQCPCCGRSMCGLSRFSRPRRTPIMKSQCPCCGRSMCGRVHPAGRPHPPLSQCPCCGRSMCGLSSCSSSHSPVLAAVSMPLLRAVDVRAKNTILVSVT